MGTRKRPKRFTSLFSVRSQHRMQGYVPKRTWHKLSKFVQRFTSRKISAIKKQILRLLRSSNSLVLDNCRPLLLALLRSSRRKLSALCHSDDVSYFEHFFPFALLMTGLAACLL